MPKLRSFLKTVDVSAKKSINWHPGHMRSGMKNMIGKLRTVDCVIEVHDARIPFTGRNEEFKSFMGVKPKVLVLNKCDLADLSKFDYIQERLRQQGDESVICTDLTGNSIGEQSRSYTKILEKALASINRSERFNREGQRDFKLMVVGIPNSGKSTLINRLRQHFTGRGGEATKTGAQAGVTKHVEFRIKACLRPPVYILDTPGILAPGSTKDESEAMRLALCASINDKVLNPGRMTQYLLDHLNKNNNLFYVEVLGLEKLASSHKEVLQRLKELRWNGLNQLKKERDDINEDYLYWSFIKDFRRGRFGRVIFD